MRWMGLISIAAVSGMATAAHPGSGDNLIVNGSFEQHVVQGTWDLYQSIPGWTLESGPGIELQRGVGGWSAYDGDQWLELDADQNGPGGGHIAGEQGSSSLFQEVATLLGQSYMLTVSFSPRPGVMDNHLIVQWNHEIVIDETASGIGLDNTSWQQISVLVTADGDSSKLILGDLSVNDTLGTFVDGIRLVAVPAPGAIALLLGACLLGRGRRR